MAEDTGKGSINNERFKVEEAMYYENNYKTIIKKYIVTRDGLPMTEVINWLDDANLELETSYKQYAYIFRRYFAFIDRFKLGYRDVKRGEVIREYLKEIAYSTANRKVSSNKIKVSYTELYQNQNVISMFYLWLDEMLVETSFNEYCNNVMIEEQLGYSKKGNKNYKKSLDYKKETIMKIKEYDFQYYYVWGINHLEKLNIKPKNCKVREEEYIKWYSLEQKEAIKDNFRTLRDLAIFSLTLHGCRIEEALTINFVDYERNKKRVYISKSKTLPRYVYLDNETLKIINNYIYNERDLLLNDMNFNCVDDTLFLNLKNGKSKGKKVTQSNYRRILKSSAKKAGLDPNLIRSHSGRSSRVQEMLREGASYEVIRNTMGWSNSDSIKNYRKFYDEVIAESGANKITERKRKEDV